MFLDKEYNKKITLALYISLFVGVNYSNAENVEFNIDVLDLVDRDNVDLSKFSNPGYIPPGNYNMKVTVNNSTLPKEENIKFTELPGKDKTQACLNKDLVNKFALKESFLDKLKWSSEANGDECLEYSSLNGVDATGDLSNSSLAISIPQAYLEYSDENWDPPSSWDDGISGVMLDYNINTQIQKNLSHQHNTTSYLSGNGTIGANLGAWRARADWQTKTTKDNFGSKSTFDWARFYVYRSLPSILSSIVIGENYLDSNIYDSFRYIGANLFSDDNMLPPNLRGYAPEVTGVAKSNATVTISQNNVVLYETQVAAGPFRIQDLNSALSGNLNVKIQEQDGTINSYEVNTATIPYLTRPGQVRYKVTAGKPSNWEHKMHGPTFATGEFSWGINNGWSLYGGMIGSESYNSISLGAGRDLLFLGAISADITRSMADLNDSYETGQSYRLSYSKLFNDYNSQITFAGYRFSQKNYMSMSEYIDATLNTARVGMNKEMYTISFNKMYPSIELSSYISYYRQTYWDAPMSERYSFSLVKNFDLESLKNISVSLNAYRHKNSNSKDDGVVLSVSVPIDQRSSLSYTGIYGNNASNNLSYYVRPDNETSYTLTGGNTRKGANISGSFSKYMTLAQFNANANYSEGNYSSLGANLQGGLTLTPKGGALHRAAGSDGGSRILIDTGDVENIPITSYTGKIYTNYFGKAVTSDVNDYYRNIVKVDVNKLDKNTEVKNSVLQSSLTKGAIGYKKIDVVVGQKIMGDIRLSNGNYPPFGATVTNDKDQALGIVGDEGNIYLTGLNSGDKIYTKWDGDKQCTILVPNLTNSKNLDKMLLPCN